MIFYYNDIVFIENFGDKLYAIKEEYAAVRKRAPAGRTLPERLECCEKTALNVRVENYFCMADFMNLLHNKVYTIDGIRNVETSLILNYVKRDYNWEVANNSNKKL